MILRAARPVVKIGILEAVRTKKIDLLPAPFVHRLAVYIRNIFPGLTAMIMEKRAKKQRKIMEKVK